MAWNDYLNQMINPSQYQASPRTYQPNLTGQSAFKTQPGINEPSKW